MPLDDNDYKKDHYTAKNQGLKQPSDGYLSFTKQYRLRNLFRVYSFKQIFLLCTIRHVQYIYTSAGATNPGSLKFFVSQKLGVAEFNFLQIKL